MNEKVPDKETLSSTYKASVMDLGSYLYNLKYASGFFFLLALQPPSGVVFYSPLAGFSLLSCEVS